jgi:hypothetical protein
MVGNTMQQACRLSASPSPQLGINLPQKSAHRPMGTQAKIGLLARGLDILEKVLRP